MSDTIKKNEQGEIVELGHDPWPGYRTAFNIVFALGIFYLILAFCGVLSHGGGH